MIDWTTKPHRLRLVSNHLSVVASAADDASWSVLELHTHVYWMISLAHRKRLPPELNAEPLRYGRALRQLAKIQQTERDYECAILKRSSELIGLIINEDENSHDFTD